MDRMVKKLGFDETHQNWVNNAMTGHIGAITTVLLAHLPRLENLEISGPNATMQIMLGLALLNAHTISRETGQDRSTLPFASIKTVSYELDPTDTMLDPWLNYTALSFFFLPRLEDLCVHIPWGSPAVWPSEETPNPTKLGFLRAVVYRKDGLGAKVVEMILKACPALKTLHYNTIWHSNDSSGLDLTEMSSVLRAAAGPIRELFIFAMRVPYSPVQMHSTAFNVVAMVMGPPQLEIEHPETFVTGELSLASMVHVEWLFISWIHLFGLAPDANLPLSRSTFPPEMTKLTIDSTGLMYEDYPYWGHFDRVRKARDFISVCRAYAPHLVRIELGYGLFDDHLLEDRIKRDLEHAGKLQGVEVAFSSCCFMTIGYTLGNPGEDEEVPDDWQWLVPDENDGAASDISLD